MSFKQIVTGHDANGDAVFLSDNDAEAVEVARIPGYPQQVRRPGPA